MLLLVWLWQGTLSQLSYRTIPYSEFKERLQKHEITRCLIREDDIQGEVQPKPPAEAGGAATNNPATTTPTNAAPAKAAAETKPYLFRTIRVEDPKLVDELQAAGVNFRGERPSLFSQFFLSWIVHIGIMILLWSFIGRRIGRAGESLLCFGKS